MSGSFFSANFSASSPGSELFVGLDSQLSGTNKDSTGLELGGRRESTDNNLDWDLDSFGLAYSGDADPFIGSVSMMAAPNPAYVLPETVPDCLLKPTASAGGNEFDSLFDDDDSSSVSAAGSSGRPSPPLEDIFGAISADDHDHTTATNIIENVNNNAEIGVAFKAPQSYPRVAPIRLHTDAIPLMSLNCQTGAVQVHKAAAPEEKQPQNSPPVTKLALNRRETDELIAFLQNGGKLDDARQAMAAKEEGGTRPTTWVKPINATKAKEEKAPSPKGIARLKVLQQEPPAKSRAHKQQSLTPDAEDRLPKRYNVMQKTVDKPLAGMTKQAQYARWYRKRNKEYTEQLEGEIAALTAKKGELDGEVGDLKQMVVDLRTEVTYLRGVLANSSALAPLLGNATVLSNRVGAKLQFVKPGAAAEGGRKRQTELESDGGAVAKRPKREGASAAGGDAGSSPGVCLHVQDGQVSVELCGRCNRQSRCEA